MGRITRTSTALIAALAMFCLYASTAGSAQSNRADIANPANLPSGLYPALLSAIQADAPAGYEAVRRRQPNPNSAVAVSIYGAANPTHKFDVDFGAESIALGSLDAKTWRLGMALVGYGYGSDIRPAPPAQLHVAGNRVEYRRGDTAAGSPPQLTEWYLNGPLGLEQGFTLLAPPPGDSEQVGDL